jgi:flagellar assembly factor FliW
MIVETVRFGRINVEDDSIIRMPRGMYGFEDETQYCLVQHSPNTLFKWLQSTTTPSLAFVVVDPSRFFADYGFQLSSVEAECLGLSAPGDAVVLATVNMGSDNDEITANLAGPIVINVRSLRALQVALDDERYGTRHPLSYSEDATGAELRKAA